MKPHPFLMMAAIILCTIHTHAQSIAISSPAGQLEATIHVEAKRLTWSLAMNHHPLVLPSSLGITIGNIDLGDDVKLGSPLFSLINNSYPWQGVHRTNTNHYRQALIPVTQSKTGIRYQLECRAFDDGFAYRYIVPAANAKDTTLVNGEASSWTIPQGSQVWYQENIYYYEGLHYDTPIAKLGSKQLGPPTTYQTPDGN